MLYKIFNSSYDNKTGYLTIYRVKEFYCRYSLHTMSVQEFAADYTITLRDAWLSGFCENSARDIDFDLTHRVVADTIEVYHDGLEIERLTLGEFTAEEFGERVCKALIRMHKRGKQDGSDTKPVSRYFKQE